MTNAKTQKQAVIEAHNQLVRERIAATQLRLLDGLDAVLDKINPPAAPSPPVTVARRMLANRFRLWQFCDLSRCRRSRCCRGEPRHCISVAIPLLPADTIEHMIRSHQAPGKRGRQPRAR